MEMPIEELLDRYSILTLKNERIPGESQLKAELCYSAEILKLIKKGVKINPEWVDELYEINAQIWDLESDIRACKEEELGLEEVGRRAIQIRKLNKIRVTIKNKIIDEIGVGFKDVKMNHGSE